MHSNHGARTNYDEQTIATAAYSWIAWTSLPGSIICLPSWQRATPVSGKEYGGNINHLKPIAVFCSFACLLGAFFPCRSLSISHAGGRVVSPRSSAFVSKMMEEVLHGKLMDLMLCPQRKKSMPLSTGLIKPLRRTLTVSTWSQWIQKQMTSSRRSVMA